MELSSKQQKMIQKLINKKSVQDKAVKCIELIFESDKNVTHGEMMAIGIMLMETAKKEIQKEVTKIEERSSKARVNKGNM